MSKLEELWSNRFRYLMKEIGKYGRLIFNDHFSVILFAILGFFMFFYREQLIILRHTNINYLRLPFIIISALLLALISAIGNPLWLMKEADKSYIYAQGKKWQAYWLKGTLIGGILPIIINVGLIGLLFPFLSVLFNWGQIEFVQIVFVQIIMVASHYLNIFLSIYQSNIGSKLMIMIIYVLLLLGGMLFFPSSVIHVLLVISLIFLLLLVLQFRSVKYKWHDFEFVIQTDLRRQSIFYKWISLFAEVPNQIISVKRRAYLDGLIERLSKNEKNIEYYLFVRLLFRNNVYSGVWLRVMLFITLLLIFTTNFYLSIGLGLIGYYMSVVQLLPMIYYYDANPFKYLYPVQSNANSAMKQVILVVLIIQWSVYSIAALISLKWNLQWLIVVAVLFIGGILLSFVYVPYWIRKKSK